MESVGLMVVQRQFWCVIAVACVFICLHWLNAVFAQLAYHTPPQNVHPLMVDQQEAELPSVLQREDGSAITTPGEWLSHRRPALHRQWVEILGKIEPTRQDSQWFDDVTRTVEISRKQKDGYLRIELLIPIEKDFWQPHLLLIPDKSKPSTCPAVIAWTSTGPDFTKPEDWWGSWLAKRGVVVLTGWSHIRNYRDKSNYRNGVNEVVYKRFGRWLPMGKMVHDVKREVEYLKSVPCVDSQKLGFMGFSLSAKSALYVAAFVPEVQATVSIDPHLAIYGDSNYLDPWYLDARRRFADISTPVYPDIDLRGTVWSLLDADPSKPGFERNHHELIALAAPRALMVIGCSTDKTSAVHSDDAQSLVYAKRGQEVYDLLNVSNRFQYVQLTCGHRAHTPEVNAAWQDFFTVFLLNGAGARK